MLWQHSTLAASDIASLMLATLLVRNSVRFIRPFARFICSFARFIGTLYSARLVDAHRRVEPAARCCLTRLLTGICRWTKRREPFGKTPANQHDWR